MFEIEDLVGFSIEKNDLPVAILSHPTGSRAVVYLHGANVTSWTTPEGQELMHVNAQPADDVIQ